MKPDKLISEFESAAGIEHTAAVEGVWRFSADGHVFGVSADESEELLWIFGEIPAPPSDREEAFRKSALEANFFMRGTGGAVFSINPETGVYTLIQSERLDRLDPKSFFSFVEKFVNTLTTWKGISESAQGVDVPAAPKGDGSEIPSLGVSGFMQV